MLELGESVIKCVCLTISLFLKKKKKKSMQISYIL